MKGNPGRSRLLLWLIPALAAVALAVVTGVSAYRSWTRREMLKTTLAWARLAPRPASARNLTISTGGSMFTRSFRASFTAPAPDIERWLNESPGTREATPEMPSPQIRRYIIAPGGGAQHAEVTVDGRTGTVFIYVYWS